MAAVCAETLRRDRSCQPDGQRSRGRPAGKDEYDDTYEQWDDGA
jgi:hypothetical protein